VLGRRSTGRVAVDLAHAHPRDVRSVVRQGRWTGLTTGFALGYVQANLVVLPGSLAEDFRRFCYANPKPMPILDVTPPGDPTPRRVARDADLRLDLPKYRVFVRGKLQREVTDIRGLWTDDMVAFLLGCSFSTEARLLKAGVRLRNIELGQNEPVFRTNIGCLRSGFFHGPLVVSMRPIVAEKVELAARISAEYPLAHGGPVHIGDPAGIGIRDLRRPDWGHAIDMLPGEVPMFWACGVTPQAAIAECRPPIAITHAPGHMFITDLADEDIRGVTSLAG
jgi:uncharacterized protein YcsI (UPF0317 family)